MSGLTFSIAGAEPCRHVASPTIRFRLRIANRGAPIEAIVLRAQIRIEPQWRSYDAKEQGLMRDLFGEASRWEKTLHALSWADLPVAVPAFEDTIEVDVRVPCTYDFDLAASRYTSALGGGEIPLRFFFSGSIFREGPQTFAVELVPWSSECAYRMPHEVWRGAMAACYGDAAMIKVDRETFERLQGMRAETDSTTWEEAFGILLDSREITP